MCTTTAGVGTTFRVQAVDAYGNLKTDSDDVFSYAINGVDYAAMTAVGGGIYQVGAVLRSRAEPTLSLLLISSLLIMCASV